MPRFRRGGRDTIREEELPGLARQVDGTVSDEWIRRMKEARSWRAVTRRRTNVVLSAREELRQAVADLVAVT
jgi:hypothetical protein